MRAATIGDVRLLDGFADAELRAAWPALLARSPLRSVFLTWEWQQAWWATFGRGELLLLGVEREGGLDAVAPLYADSGMVFFVGSGGSDYLDFLGNAGEPTLVRLLEAAASHTEGFVGIRLYHLPHRSPTTERLPSVAATLGLTLVDEGHLVAPALDLGEAGPAATRKKSLVRHDRFFVREGDLEVLHLTSGAEILPHLPQFFDQHIARWRETPHPSLFLDQRQRDFYRRLTVAAGDTGWLRFMRLKWMGQPIAFHFGFSLDGTYLWYKPSFDSDLARHSPGEALLRRLLLAAMDEGAHTFDFGLGDEPFKRRFATRVEQVRTWGLYPA